ncbi:sigma-70 family RNA polymerase sigma factor [Streptomyces puniciscabiei]|uniref:sigma-70 family RNA polymerase sigma factor n=1 Tax=Streptomyces puniciscabiei TaxID=164348 RepID=UPI003EBF90C1
MPTDISMSRPGTPTTPSGGTPARRTHDDGPDTAELFARLAHLDDGPERDAVRDELVGAWLPMAHRIASRFRDRGESIEDLRQAPGSPEPSVAAIAAHTGLAEDEVAAGMEALESFSALSLDAELTTGDDGYSLGDTVAATDGSYGLVVDREAAKAGLRRLPERERAILYMRFFEDLTQSRIADKLGISQMHVSQLISRSCARLRDEALAHRTGGRRAA